MFRISNTNTGENSVSLQVTGRLGEEDLDYFRDLLTCYLNQKTHLYLDFDGCMYLDLKFRQYLREIRDAVEIVHLPEYLHAEIMGDT